MYNAKHNQILADELAHRSLAQVILETALLVAMAVAALVGNSCVLYVFFKAPRLRRKVTSYYLITLSISDVLCSIVGMPILAVTSASGRDVIGFKGGQIFGNVSILLVHGSILTMTMVAVNRFFCVVRPRIYRKWFKPKPTLLMIIGMWIASFLVVFISFWSGMIVFQFYPGRFTYYPAFTNYTNEIIVNVFAHTTTTLLPLVLSAYCYWKVQKTVRGHYETVSRTLNAGRAGNTSDGSMPVEDIRITKSLVALVCGFAICWIPSSSLIHADVYMNMPRSAELVFIYTACLSSVINPIIYNAFNRPFRRQFMKIVRPRSNDVLPVVPLRDRTNRHVDRMN